MRALAVALVAAVLSTPQLASADEPTPTATGGASDNGLWVKSTRRNDAGRRPDNKVSNVPASVPAVGTAACAAAEEIAGEFVNHAFCTADDDQPTLTLADIQRAFAELPLPASQPTIQPPDGLTLVNFDTNFYTTNTEPITHTVTLLDQQVTLEATPTTYTWDFGDGETTTTKKPGAPYPTLTITHDYQRKGDYAVGLATTYTGRYRIADGPWNSIPDTVTITSPPQQLRAIEAKPKLVGY